MLDLAKSQDSGEITSTNLSRVKILDTPVFVAVSILLIVFLVTYLVACCCQGSDNKWRADENGMKPVDTVYL